MLSSNDEEVAMQKSFPRWNQQHKIKMRPHLFARMLAKIALGYAVAEYGASRLNAFTPLVRGVIRGTDGDWTQLVGGSLDIPAPIPGGNHLTDLSILGTGPSSGYLLCDIRLFSNIATPSYRVVVGQVTFENPEHVRAFEQHRLNGKIE
jgi:hypothetical protein